jgi:hypothetical protein
VRRSFSPKRHFFRRAFEQRGGQLALMNASSVNKAILDILSL